MKIKIEFALFTALVFVEVIVFVLYHKHSNRWILKVEPKSDGDLKQIVTSSLQINRTFAASEGNSNELALLKSIRTHCSQLSFSFVSHIIQPRLQEKRSSLFLLVLIPSGVENSNRERRNGIRSTWGNEIAHAASRVWKRVFILGKTRDSELSSEIKQESSVFNDVLVLNVTDTYHNLVIKSYSAMLWGVVHVNPRFLLKADDDVYIRVPRLISWLEFYASDPFYGGSVIRGAKVRRWFSDEKNRVAEDCLALDEYPPYCSGPFYVLSSNAVPLLFQGMQRWKPIPPEDAYMGLLAHELGLKPVDIPGFDAQRNLQDYGKCNWVSAMALGHGYGQSQFSYVQNKLQEHSDLPRYSYQCLVTEWAGFLFLFVIPIVVFVVLFTFIKLNQIVAKGRLGINNASRFYLY